MSEEKYSIIIATHNDEKDIGACLDSVLAQTYPNFELFLVNDGSTDSTGDICQQYAKKDSRIRYICGECRGALLARREGLLHLQGDYFYIMDADDLLAPDLLEKCLDWFQKNDVDMVLFDIDTFGDRKEDCWTCPISSGTILEQQVIIDFVLEYTNHSLCNKVFRRQVWEQSRRDYERYGDVRVGLDKMQLFPLLVQVKKGVYYQEALYHYRIRSTSLSHGFRPETAYDIGCPAEYSLLVLEGAGLLDPAREKKCYQNYLKSMIPRMIRLLQASCSYQKKKEVLTRIRKSDIFRKASPYATKELLGSYYLLLYRLVKMKCERILHLYYYVKKASEA